MKMGQETNNNTIPVYGVIKIVDERYGQSQIVKLYFDRNKAFEFIGNKNELIHLDTGESEWLYSVRMFDVEK